MRDKREKNKDREIYIIIKGMHDRLRSRRRSKGRKGARHILRSIYVSRKTGRSRERVEHSLELSFLIFRSINLFIPYDWV